MGNNPTSFIKAIYRKFLEAYGGTLSLLVGAYLYLSHTSELGGAGFVFVGILALFIAGYRAWSDERTRAETTEQKLIDVPRLRMVHGSFYADIRPLTPTPQTFPPTLIGVLSCLHVRIKNDPVGTTAQSIATNVIPEIYFYNDETGGLLFQIEGRWEDSPQPSLMAKDAPKHDLSSAKFAIGQIRELDIAFKYTNKAPFECYAMSNKSYEIPTWAHPKQKISAKKIKVHVRLRAVGVDESIYLRFENPDGSAELRPII